MSRVVENPKKHILSFRVDEADMELLKKVSRKTGADISTLLRRSLQVALGANRPS
jgi:hypothetical protein